MDHHRAIIDILASLTRIEQERIGPGDRLVEDLNMDSVDVVEFLMLVCRELDIEIRDEEVVGIITVADALSLAATKLARTSA